MVHRSDDRRAADADAKEQDAKLSTCEKWKAHDRFAKIFFMIIYLIINIALWIHWAYNAYNQVTQGTPQIGDNVISYSISSWCIVEQFISLAFDLNSLVVL